MHPLTHLNESILLLWHTTPGLRSFCKLFTCLICCCCCCCCYILASGTFGDGGTSAASSPLVTSHKHGVNVARLLVNAVFLLMAAVSE